MKRIYLLIIIILNSFYSGYAQWNTNSTNVNYSFGSIGIGTTNPGLKLSLQADGILDNGNAYFLAQFYRPAAQQFGVVIGYDSGGFGLLQSTGANSGLQLKYNNSGVNILGMSLSNTGFIGIGTSAPNSKLNVVDTKPGNEMTGLSLSNLNDGPGTAVGINFQPHSSQVTMAKIVAYREANSYGPTDLLFYTYNDAISPQGLNERMRISPVGNVLIGKTSQSNTAYKLDVEGSVRANQITVNTSGADFVFAKNFNLHSLTYVEKYITKNHHLPEIASAAEMQTNGMDVGDMNKKLLQKVEELTLYLIVEHKKIQNQQNAINVLKRRVETYLTAHHKK